MSLRNEIESAIGRTLRLWRFQLKVMIAAELEKALTDAKTEASLALHAETSDFPVDTNAWTAEQNQRQAFLVGRLHQAEKSVKTLERYRKKYEHRVAVAVERRKLQDEWMGVAG